VQYYSQYIQYLIFITFHYMCNYRFSILSNKTYDILAKTKHLHLNVTGGKNKRCLQPKLLL
jgi:hypothetical protein